MQCLFKWSVVVMALNAAVSAIAEGKPRARDIGVPFDGVPGANNAITDVAGVEIGHVTLISGEGKLQVGKGPIRTGATAVLPRGRNSSDPVFAGWFSLNGNGEMTGTTWIEESGFLEGPVLLTNTTSVGTVRDAVIKWWLNHHTQSQPWLLPVVAETYDGYLNDTHGFHVSMSSRHSTPPDLASLQKAMSAAERACAVSSSREVSARPHEKSMSPMRAMPWAC
jgi:D-aminopeptidase